MSFDQIDPDETMNVAPGEVAGGDETMAHQPCPVEDPAATRLTVGRPGAAAADFSLDAFEAHPGPRRERLPQIQGYDILGVLGRGGMGVVYEAIQLKLGRRVAVKLLPAIMSSAQPELAKRFQHEAANSARLHHPHIIPIYDFGESRDGYYYVMELLSGQPLNAVIQRFAAADLAAAPTSIAEILQPPGADPGDITAAQPSLQDAVAGYGDTTDGRDRRYYHQVARWIAEIADALHYAHRQGMIHRDVKPGNIYLCTDGRAVLLDFGLVKVAGDDSVTVTGALIGSCRYMSPEQIRAKDLPLDARTDIYSLGATLYESVTLQPAFVAADHSQLFEQILNRDPTPSRKVIPSVPVDLETICLKAMEKAPAGRYQTAKQMADDLHLYLRGLPILARPLGRVGRTVRFVKRHRAAALATVAVILFLAAVAVAGVFQRHARRSHLEALITQGTTFMRLQQWDKAQVALHQVLEEDPQNFHGLVNLAITKKELFYSQRDDTLLEDANRLLDQVLLVAPTRTEIWNMKGIVLRTQRRLDDAIVVLQRARELDKTYYSTWVNLGSVYALKGDLPESEAHLQKGVQLMAGSRDALPWHNLAAVQLELGEPEALESINQALTADRQADRKGVPSQLLRAKLHLQLRGQKDPALALRYAIAAEINSSPDERDPRIQRILSWAYLANREWAAAGEAARRALEYGDEPVYVHLILAASAAGSGDETAARAHLGDAESTWPDGGADNGLHTTIERGLMWFDSQAVLHALRREAENALARL